jgi:WD40 repeat protein
VSGADDNDLRVWDLERSADDQCSLVLTGHTGKVLCCCIGTCDLPLPRLSMRCKVYAIFASHVMKPLQFHLSRPAVRGMVVSGGEDKLVIVWDLKTGKMLSSMKQHTGAVLCMCTDGQRYVYTGGADHELCKWSIETLKCEVRMSFAVSGVVHEVEMWGSVAALGIWRFGEVLMSRR